jgi:pilus assembly protein CpaB
MFLRNILLAVGAVLALAGVAVLFIWSNRTTPPPSPIETQAVKPLAILVAKHAIPSHTPLRADDIDSKEVPASDVQAQNRLRGQEAEFVDKISQRNIAAGEPLLANDFVSSSCLAALVKPGYRAVSIAVDASQSITGMAQRDDRVDVILTQTFDESVTPDLGHRTVSETVLRDVRVLATDQNLKTCPNQPVLLSVPGAAVAPEARLPKTVTLELKEIDAEKLMVAGKLGVFQLALRPPKTDATSEASQRTVKEAPSVWASDVSPALNAMADKGMADPRSERRVGVRVYTGMPASEGYLCTKSSCAPTSTTFTKTEYRGAARP